MDFNIVLKVNGLSIENLDKLSYKSKLGLSLKNNIHDFDKKCLLNEMLDYINWLNTSDELDNVACDYRIKSIQSIIIKYERYYPNHQIRKVFDDILGFRVLCDEYDSILKIKDVRFKIVDRSKGKSNDDGYRGVHVYYQKDNFNYPIEIQFNTYFDRQLNDWLHDYVYKKSYDNNIGCLLRLEYEKGNIKNLEDFEEVLYNVLHFNKGC